MSTTPIPDIVEDFKSCEFNSSKLEDQNNRLLIVENKISEVNELQNKLGTLVNENALLKKHLVSSDQRQRLSNIEIKGVPMQKNEDLFKILDQISKAVGYTVIRSNINYIARVPMYNSNEKLVLVSFINRYIKEELIASYRAKKKLLTSEIGFDGNPNHVFINDHLTPDTKKLLSSVKLSLKEKGYQYIWVKFGKIHVRKNDSSKISIIYDQDDLKKFL